MKRVLRIFLGLLVLILILLMLQYPKLKIISGYAAKYLASTVFLTQRDAEAVSMYDFDVPLISLASAGYLSDGPGAEASVFGLQRREAFCRDGLGCTLLPEGVARPASSLKPFRKITKDTLPYPFGQGIPRDSVFPEVDYLELKAAIDYAFERPEEQRTRTVLVLYKDHLIAERYSDGFGPDTRVLGWSMTKSVLATLYGILQYQGALSVDEPAGIDAWREDDRSGITLNDLLRMQSGLEWDEDYSGMSDVNKMLFTAADMAAPQAEKKLAGPPGSIWNYSSGTSNLLSGLLRKRLANDQAYLDFPYRQLIDSIGMHSMLIETDLSGNFVGSSFGWASTRDWGRFGLLYLRRGNWNGTRIFAPDWADYVSRPTEHSDGRYGAHFWLNQGGAYPDVPEDLYSANGYQGQHVYIIPSKDLVIVRTGLAESPDFDANGFLKRIVASIKASATY